MNETYIIKTTTINSKMNFDSGSFIYWYIIIYALLN